MHNERTAVFYNRLADILTGAEMLATMLNDIAREKPRGRLETQPRDAAQGRIVKR